MISVLVPLRNGIEFLAACLHSVHQQTFRDWEVLVGVNGHDDDSKVFQGARAFESHKVHILDLPGVASKSHALNALVRLAKYEWTAILDVDDLWEPTKLADQISALGQYDVVGTFTQYFGERNDGPILPAGEVSHSEFYRHNPIINSSAILRKTDAKWDPRFEGVEDYALWARLVMCGRMFYNVPQILTRHRIHTASAFNTRSHDHLIAEIVAMLADKDS